MRILLVRLDHAGDVVLTVPPVVRRLKEAIPGVEIHVLTTRVGESLLRDDEDITRIIAWDAPWSVPPPGLRYVPRTVFARRIFELMMLMVRRRFARYDAIVYLSFSPWERLLTAWLGRRRLGFQGPYAHKAHRYSQRTLTHTVEFDKSQHIVLNCHRLIDALTPDGTRTAPSQLYIDSEDRQAVARRIRELLPDAPGFIAIHPGGPRSFKSWPAENFKALAERLVHEQNRDCLVLMSTHEHAELIAACGPSSNPRVQYILTQSLREFASFAAHADVVIANDGGPCHIAAAIGVPTIVVFGPTDERIYGPRGAHVHVLRGGHPDAPCSTPWQMKRPCCGNKACLREVTVEDVTALVSRLLDGTAARRAPDQDTSCCVGS